MDILIKFKKIILVFLSVFIFFTGLLLFLILYFDESSTRYYMKYNTISMDDSIHYYLPDFFPKNSSDLSFFSNLDLNIWYVEFSLSDGDAKTFEASLNDYPDSEWKKERIALFEDVTKVWCKNGKDINNNVTYTYSVGKLNKKLSNRYVLLENKSYSQCLVKP